MSGKKWFISGYRLWSIIEENRGGNSNSNSYAGWLAISHSFKLSKNSLDGQMSTRETMKDAAFGLAHKLMHTQISYTAHDHLPRE